MARKTAAVAERPAESTREPSGKVPYLYGNGTTHRILFTDPTRADQGEFCYDYNGSTASDKAAREYLESLGYTVVAQGPSLGAAGTPGATIVGREGSDGSA